MQVERMDTSEQAKNNIKQNKLTNHVNKGKRQGREKVKVEIDLGDTWEKMKNTQVTLSMAEYLALNRNVARDVKEGIMYMYRRRQKNPGRLNSMNDPVIINNLKSANLIEEQKLNNVNIIEPEEEDSECEESDYDNSTTSGTIGTSDTNSDSEFDSSDGSSDDEEDSIVEYPYDHGKMKFARPSRILIAIDDQVVEAVLDSGAAVSVLSRKLANRLNLGVNSDDKVPLSGFGSGGKSIPCGITTDVNVRIGGRLRREHFCIDETEVERDVCLLGRSWIINHDIRLTEKGSIIVIPIKKGSDYIEVQCLSDEARYEDEIKKKSIVTAPISTDQRR
ncbi:MAG: hypothetical protein EXX96DRAFT_590950 [Benjaminiella poitrasii]|nr:MAG: hypothetical protein EXX96DRAFT_590950 [Benjaminiella poitrasii]